MSERDVILAAVQRLYPQNSQRSAYNVGWYWDDDGDLIVNGGGYDGFFTKFRFAADGQLLSMKAYE
jgi:hypothetical protein